MQVNNQLMQVNNQQMQVNNQLMQVNKQLIKHNLIPLWVDFLGKDIWHTGSRVSAFLAGAVVGLADLDH